MSGISIEKFYREDFGRILASLIRSVGGDFDLAEEALQDAFAAALVQWPREGTPASPRAWILSVARNKAIDKIRRESRFDARRGELAFIAELESQGPAIEDADQIVPDERLRLIFTCCHPALADEAKVALSLRTLCGLTTEEIARAFLIPAPTMAQRLVRAKRKIAAAKIPYQVPGDEILEERLEAAMAVVYLVFNEGYSASFGASVMRTDLCVEAIRLGRLLFELMPARAEAQGLLAMMLLHDARRPARARVDGEIILLEEQDRSRWDRAQIAEGNSLAAAAMRSLPAGPYVLQAAIAAEHARATVAADTDWKRIAVLYAMLLAVRPSPVVELNRAVAIAMADGPEAGLGLIDAIEARGDLDGYHFLWAARADLLRRLGRRAEAASAYEKALALAGSEPERRFLKRRLAEAAG